MPTYPMPGESTFSASQEKAMRAARAELGAKLQNEQDWKEGRNSAPTVSPLPPKAPENPNTVAQGD